MSATRFLLIGTVPFFTEVGAMFRHDSSSVAVVGLASNTEEALALMGECQPDVLIVDIGNAERVLECLAILEAIRRSYPHALVIGHTQTWDVSLIQIALRAGTFGFINSRTTHAELDEVIDTVSQGYPLLPKHVARQLLQELQVHQ